MLLLLKIMTSRFFISLFASPPLGHALPCAPHLRSNCSLMMTTYLLFDGDDDDVQKDDDDDGD